MFNIKSINKIPNFLTILCCSLASIFILLFFFQNLNGLLDHDILFHMAVAREYNILGSVDKIPWVYDSIWSQGYGDTHLLYHQFLRFVEYSDIQLWISLCIGLLIFTYLVSSKFSNSQEIIFFTIVFLFSSVPFIGRLMFGKGLILFLIVFYIFLAKWKSLDKRWIFFLSFIAVWVYPLAPLVPVYALLVWIASFPRLNNTEYGIDQDNDHKKTNKGLIYCLVGFSIGILAHPSFPNQFLAFYLEWWIQIFKPDDLESIAEWNPPGLNLFIKTYFILIILFILTRMKGNKILAGISLLGLLLSYFNTKTLEWTVPIILFYLGTSQDLRFLIKNKIFLTVSSIALIIQLGYMGSDLNAHSQFVSTDNVRSFAKSVCVDSSISHNSKIFIRWDDFPAFSYECPSNVYPFGMNPIYSHYHDRQRYLMIRRFWEDRTIDPSAIPSYLGYKYLVIHSKRDGSSLHQNIINSNKWKLLIESENYFLYETNEIVKK